MDRMIVNLRNFQRGIDVTLWLLDGISSGELERRIRSPYPGPMPPEWVVETEPYKLLNVSQKTAVAA